MATLLVRTGDSVSDSASPRQPVVFISHGAPNILLRDTPFTRALRGLAPTLPAPPRAVVIFSAHWESTRLSLTAGSPGPERPYETIHDFYGFEPELYRVRYPAAGDDALVAAVTDAFAAAGLPVDHHPVRGLDHGAWVPLALVWPQDPPPVVQVSLDAYASPADQVAVGRALAPLRDHGVLLMTSGGTVHNLGLIYPEDSPTQPWAPEFDDWLLDRLGADDLASLLDYPRLAPHAARAVPRAEHFVNFFLALGCAGGGPFGPTSPAVLVRDYMYGTLSMLCLRFD